jgi:hypothetical protein
MLHFDGLRSYYMTMAASLLTYLSVFLIFSIHCQSVHEEGKIQLTVNTGFSKEVLLQGTSHPLKVTKFHLLINTVCFSQKKINTVCCAFGHLDLLLRLVF